MFYFLPSTLLVYNAVLIAAAVAPALLLMLKVYRSDRLEHESARTLWRLARSGVFASLIAMVAEKVLSVLLGISLSAEDPLYNVILYFGIVAFCEEGAKLLMLRKSSWRSPEFNCMFDGVVYAVFVSLGFAIWENISYVMAYGFATALVRAVTAIPGHACFGVFMGVFYASAKRYQAEGEPGMMRLMGWLALIVPAAIHGAYDYIATAQTSGYNWYFIGFIAVLFIVSFILVGRTAKRDRYLDGSIAADDAEDTEEYRG